MALYLIESRIDIASLTSRLQSTVMSPYLDCVDMQPMIKDKKDRLFHTEQIHPAVPPKSLESDDNYILRNGD